MTLRADEQRDAVDAIVALYTLDATAIGGGVHRLVAAARDGATLRYQGVAYRPIPIELDGVDYRAGGTAARPTLAVSRLDTPFVAAALGADDFRGATLRRIRTLARYLDGAPDADPDRHWPAEAWRVERLVRQTRDRLVWQLASPLDLDLVRLPRRQVLRTVCAWVYRRWTGSAWDYSAATCPYTGDTYFDAEDARTDLPARDRCSRRLSGCLARFGRRSVPFGGFVGVGRTRPR